MDDKRTHILNAAMRVVSAYGFRRSSMEDIAQEAGISRPAIYQVFRNKDDVFLSCVDLVIKQAFDTGEAAAAGQMGAKAQLLAYLTAYMVYYHRLLVAGPHGQELLELNSKIGGNKTQTARERFIGVINRMMGEDETAEAGRILAHAAEGIKMKAPDEAMLTARLGVLVGRFVS